MEKPRRAESPDAPMVIPSTNQPRRGSRGRTPDISPQTSYRLDNRNYTGGGKESDEQEVTCAAARPQPSAASAESATSSRTPGSIRSAFIWHLMWHLSA